MNEAEWNACTEPYRMLAFLRRGERWPRLLLRLVGFPAWRPSPRKLQMFACASLRQGQRIGTDPVLDFIEAAERCEDGETDYNEVHAAYEKAQAWGGEHRPVPSLDWDTFDWETISAVLEREAACRSAQDLVECGMLRCLFGHLPFRPLTPLAPSLLGWENGLVVRLAEAAYEERELPSGHLDNARLAVLADALEEAGSTDDRLLAHLRSEGPHVRGCWSIDALLGKS